MRRLFARFGMQVEMEAGEVVAMLALPAMVSGHIASDSVALLAGWVA
jgi:hypothetical protein